MNQMIGLVEDDPNIRDIVKAYLEKEGYQVLAVDTAEKAWDIFQEKKPDIWVLDIMLPGMDGYEFCKKIRQTSEVPIIIISAKDEEVDKILGLELGGDDYLTKPFSPRELVARTKRHLKRWEAMRPNAEEEQETIKVGALELNESERQAYFNGKEVEVTTKEFEMLKILASQENRAFSREELLIKVWGEDYYGSDRAVDDLIKRLRKKMKELPIETVWGHGYRLREKRS
ncbi:response regulator transcription factor [Halobacillus karajensis]|uniref:Transcriptional regulatory protein CssR n=1 Tax=Halobacillus karajensis TaxID=195088 RepID=A0A024P5F8_9BACI|nr:response regulator transcription factor [Halobacillus karajensis]CDQ18721.1 Transcriptional regulatory protein CssR [Halobacillus karajensis]CDQ23207.1 Transcriptional regulatory protein CssR [Halobacillus karajensis]CDQ26689.1 Transcriptional regulatory protein CssR [Halobacillus karajensis]